MGGAATKRKMYDSDAEFERDRTRLHQEGWIVTERQVVAVPGWQWVGDGDLFGWLLTLPLQLLGWRLYGQRPERQLAVTYVRPKGQ